MLSQEDVERLYDALTGRQSRVLRFNGERFQWWPMGRQLPIDNVVGVYDAGVTFPVFCEDVRWAESNMHPERKNSKNRITAHAAWCAAWNASTPGLCRNGTRHETRTGITSA